MSRTVIVTEPRKMTISNIFIQPIFKIGRENIVKNGLINTFFFNNERNIVYDDYVLHLLFKPEDQIRFSGFVAEERQRLGGLFLDEYDYEGGYTVLVYKIPDKYNDDIKLLLEGRYSELSDTLMNDIPRTVRVVLRQGVRKDETYLAHLIHERNKGLRDLWENLLDVDLPKDSEVWNRFTEEEETLSEKIVKDTSAFYKSEKE